MAVSPGAADTPPGSASARPPLGFAATEPVFIDFGCGIGESMHMAETIARGPGVGIDIAADRVAAAQEAGHDVIEADLLHFEQRAVAQASFAIDVLPELANQREFETACINLLRAARDFTVIQHHCFDTAEALLARGLIAAGHLDKAIRLRPRAADYVHFIQTFGARLDVVGLAVFGLGEPRTEAATLSGLRGPLLTHDAGAPAYRSLRVVIGRKAISRFHIAMQRARGGGDLLLHWEQGG